MTRDRRCVVVVPCYNERDRLDLEAFARFVEERSDVALLFVDDGSTDGTDALLSALHGREPRSVSVLSLDRNSGKAEAVRQGMLAAFEEGAVFAGYWDADLSTPLEEFDGLLATLEGNDALLGVIGSRVRLLGRTIERNPIRHYVGRVFATGASLALNLPVYDTQCGAKLFRATRHTVEAFRQPFRGRWTFDVELLARLKVPGERMVAVEEYPLRQWRDAGASKVTLWDGLVVPYQLLLLGFREWRRNAQRQRGGRVQATRQSTEEGSRQSLRK